MAMPTYNVYLTADDTFTQVDIGAYVISVNITRGRSRELDKFEAGTFSVVLNNRNRYFDPKFTSSPYVDYLTPKRAISIVCNGIYIFEGFVQDWNYNYNVSGESTANVTGADAFSYLSQMSLVGGVQISEKTGARLTKIFSTPKDAGITYPPLNPASVFDTGLRTLQADTIAAGTNALEYAQLIEKTEGGYFFIDAYGSITFHQSASIYGNGNSFTDSGASSAIVYPYQSIEVVYGSELLYNKITLTRQGGIPQVVTDPASITKYGSIDYQDDGFLHNADASTLQQALLLAAKYSEPEYRFESITVLLNPLTTAQQQSLTQIDLAYLVDVTFKPNQTGSEITKTVRVVGIDHQISVDTHSVTFRFKSTDYEQMILNDAVFGTVNLNVLGF